MDMEQLEAMKEKTSKTLATMIDYLGLEASLKVEEKGDRIAVIISSDDAGRIIGKKGQTLESLQLLLNRMMFKNDPECPRILLDIDGYSRKKREDRGERGDRGGDRGERRGFGRGRGGDRRDRRDRDGDRGGDDRRDFGGPGQEENEENLRQQALDAAKEVKRWGEPVTLPPMNAHDRRIIHITLQDDAELKSESEGDGNLKKVIISLKQP